MEKLSCICPICNKELSYIPRRHVAKHGISLEEFKEKYPVKDYPTIRYTPNQGISPSDEVRAKFKIKSQAYYDAMKLRDTKGEKNSFYGKTHTTEAKSKMGRNQKGENNAFFGKTHSKESREKMSNARTNNIINNNGDYYYHNNGKYTSTKTNIVESYDSKLELFRMIQMDNDTKIVSWTKKHKIKISYKIKNDDIFHNYVPDFLVEYKNSPNLFLEEVKGHGINSDFKKEALINYCKINNLNWNWFNQYDEIFKNYKNWLRNDYKKIN